jgi:hypothetical protein
VPAIAAAAIAWPVWKAGLIEIRGARGAKVIAVLGASVQTAAAVVLAFYTVRRHLPRAAALAIACALAFGTGYWHTVSQTLWQHETAVFGMALSVFALTALRPESRVPLLLAGAGLALAVTSRLQLAPAVLMLLAGTVFVAGLRRALIPMAITLGAVAVLAMTNIRWFDNPLGAAPLLEALHPTVHATTRSFDPMADGFPGLLFSPNRGLLVYSPVVAVAFIGVPIVVRQGRHSMPVWCLMAAVVQYATYGSYAVWWAGHTYGPRYMLDVLPLLVPLAERAIGFIRLRRPLGMLTLAAMTWSVVVAGTGAFAYPDDRWNVNPADVDRNHERLWDWSDLQIVRCWRVGPSPGNFELYVRE